MKQEKFSERLISAMKKLKFKSKAEFAEKLNVPYRTLENYIKGSMDKRDPDKYTAPMNTIIESIDELMTQKEMGISFPQKAEGIEARIIKTESQVRKLNSLIDTIYERLETVEKKLQTSQK